MAEKCASCPFREDGDRVLCANILARTLLQAQQVCHHPRMHGKKETHLCRGARDEQLTVLHRLGWIDSPTDQAFAEASLRILGK